MKNFIQNRKLWLVAMISICVLSGQALFADKSLDDAKKFLQSQKKQKAFTFISAKSQRLFKADVIKARQIFETSNGGFNILCEGVFLKRNGQFKMFRTPDELICSKTFLKTLNSKFKIKGKKEIKAFRRLLFLIDNDLRGDVFKENGKLCFVVRKFFDELTYYEVALKRNGKISEIKYFKKDRKLPECEYKFDAEFVQPKGVAKKDLVTITKMLKKEAPSTKFDLIAWNIEGLKKDLKLYDCRFTASYVDGDCSHSNISEFVLIKNNKKYEIVRNKEQVFKNEAFNKALCSSYVLKTEKQAKAFEKILDIIKPADKFVKKFYKKHSVWCFIREKSFDDLQGLLVVVNKKGKILYIEPSRKINDSAIKQAEIKGSNQPTDYAFTLVDPDSNEITVRAGDKIPVKIMYNSAAVNVKGAYIATIVDGFMQGFSAASDMQSPFTDEIPVDYIIEKFSKLESVVRAYGKGVHVIEYALMANEEVLSSIKIKVTIR